MTPQLTSDGTTSRAGRLTGYAARVSVTSERWFRPFALAHVEIDVGARTAANDPRARPGKALVLANALSARKPDLDNYVG